MMEGCECIKVNNDRFMGLKGLLSAFMGFPSILSAGKGYRTFHAEVSASYLSK